MGAELGRLKWSGPDIHFRIGTGPRPSYRENRKVQCSVAEDCLPIVLNRWEDKQFSYEEESFATLLEGPLDPTDPARSEQTPAVCMVQLRVTNKNAQPGRAHVWFTIEPAGALELSGRRVMAKLKKSPDPETRLLRAVLTPPRGATLRPHADSPANTAPQTIVTEFEVAGNGSEISNIAIPFVSDVSGANVDKLEVLDFARQRERVATYWRDIINKTTRFTTPEPRFNALARSVVPHIHLSTTKDPKSGLFMVCAASFYYDVCANESCFQTQLLDTLGDTRRAGQYLKTLVDLQGSESFPGNYAEPHDGVFHGAIVDKDYRYSSSNYALDHGTVLWSLAKHYFSTRDAEWLRKTLPHMLKAIDWIQRQRALTRQLDIHGERPTEYGLLPAGHLEDNDDWGYWFSVNAYCVAGMIDTAAAMKDIGDPRAQKIAEQAAEYREALRTSVQRCTELAPVMRTRDGTYSPCVPTRTGQRFRRFGPLSVQYYSRYGKPDLPCYRLAAIREVLYGPMIQLNLQVFDPDEPIANWILDDWEDNVTLSSSGGFNVHGFTDDNLWFSQGGMVFQANLQNPIWVYLNRQEAPAAIRGLYNAFVSCLYPDVNAFTEEYHEWTHTSGPFFKSPDEARFVNRLRDLLVLERGEDLWLAGGVPRRWLASRDGIRVDSLNTLFGPVSYTLRAGDEPGTIVARIAPPVRNKPRRVWLYLRLPDKKQPKSVRVGNTNLEFDAKLERVLLPASDGPMDVYVRY